MEGYYIINIINAHLSISSSFCLEIPQKQGNLRDMRKIHVTRQFFEASGPQGHYLEKTKNPFIDMGSRE